MGKILSFFAVIALVIFGLVFSMTKFLVHEDKLVKADAIVAVSGGDTTSRAKKAIEVYEKGLAPLLVFSGAAKDPSSPSNARVMKKLAIDAGVPDYAIRIDEFSRDTKENAKGVKNILIDSKKVILVTSEYHQRRAHRELKAALPEVDIIDAPAKDKDWNKYTWWLNPYGWWVTTSEVVKSIL